MQGKCPQMSRRTSFSPKTPHQLDRRTSLDWTAPAMRNRQNLRDDTKHHPTSLHQLFSSEEKKSETNYTGLPRARLL